MKIFLDAGHGGKDAGAISGSRYEKNDVLRLTLELGKVLSNNGVEVKYTRTDDTFIDLSSRARIANQWGADYFISLHRNSAGPTATGVETWIHSKSNSNTLAFGTELNNALVSSMGLNNRGVKKGYIGNPNADYAVNRETNMTSALLEIGFISNNNDNAVFDTNFNNIVNELTKAICDFTNHKLTEQPQTVPTPSPTLQQSGLTYKIGDKVTFRVCHISSTSDKDIQASEMQKNNGVITKIIEGVRNPYLLENGMCWVNDGDIISNEIVQPSVQFQPQLSQSIQVGSIVSLKQGAKDYKGNNVASFVYTRHYRVDELKGDRAVLDLRGLCTAFKVSDLIV